MSTTERGPDVTGGDELDPSEVTTPENADEAAAGDTEAERSPLEKARSEARNLRDRAKVAEARAEELSRALFTARVAATGQLTDATDLVYDADLVDDPEALTEAIDALLSTKPHLKARTVSGAVGQGTRGEAPRPTDFSALLR